MFLGAHIIIYSTDAEADRAFFRDVLKYDHADAGHGWLIFKLPPAEIAFHPAESNGKHEFYFMTEDVNAFIAEMTTLGRACTDIHEEPWGLLTQMTLPGGGQLGVYQPTHASPLLGTE